MKRLRVLIIAAFLLSLLGIQKTEAIVGEVFGGINAAMMVAGCAHMAIKNPSPTLEVPAQNEGQVENGGDVSNSQGEKRR